MTEPRAEPCGTPQEGKSLEEERLPAITEQLGLVWTPSQTSTLPNGFEREESSFLLLDFSTSESTRGVFTDEQALSG